MDERDSMTRIARRIGRIAGTSAVLLVSIGACAAVSPAAEPAVDSDCDRPALALDPAITPALVDRAWGSGATRTERPAAIELRCAGSLADSLPLHAPLARLAPEPLRGVPTPTWLVTEDLTAPAGTTSGPATLLVEVADRHLRFALATTPDGHRQPIVLAATGKAAWRAVRTGGADDYLLVNCQAVAGDFMTSYRHYRLTPQGWTVQSLMRHELWESDGGFPPASQFP